MTNDQEDALQAMVDQAQELDLYDTEPPKVVYVYRYQNGGTAVRAPDIEDPDIVTDMLNEALRAMVEGSPVIRN